jgi:hypothetical protein
MNLSNDPEQEYFTERITDNDPGQKQDAAKLHEEAVWRYLRFTLCSILWQ